MKRIVHYSEYIMLTDDVCRALYKALIINKCEEHDYHPAFSEDYGDRRNEEDIWASLVEIAKAYGDGMHKVETKDAPL